LKGQAALKFQGRSGLSPGFLKHETDASSAGIGNTDGIEKAGKTQRQLNVEKHEGKE